jgi:hypothetical protein
MSNPVYTHQAAMDVYAATNDWSDKNLKGDGKIALHHPKLSELKKCASSVPANVATVTIHSKAYSLAWAQGDLLAVASQVRAPPHSLATKPPRAWKGSASHPSAPPVKSRSLATSPRGDAGVHGLSCAPAWGISLSPPPPHPPTPLP